MTNNNDDEFDEAHPSLNSPGFMSSFASASPSTFLFAEDLVTCSPPPGFELDPWLADPEMNVLLREWELAAADGVEDAYENIKDCVDTERLRFYYRTYANIDTCKFLKGLPVLKRNCFCCRGDCVSCNASDALIRAFAQTFNSGVVHFRNHSPPPLSPQTEPLKE